MSDRTPEQERLERIFRAGIGWGMAANLLIGFALLGYSLFITIGIGLSEDPQRAQNAMRSVTYLWLAAPLMVNLPGLAYAYFIRSKRFLAGWGLGFLAALLLAGITMGCVLLFNATLPI